MLVPGAPIPTAHRTHSAARVATAPSGPPRAARLGALPPLRISPRVKLGQDVVELVLPALVEDRAEGELGDVLVAELGGGAAEVEAEVGHRGGLEHRLEVEVRAERARQRQPRHPEGGAVTERQPRAEPPLVRIRQLLLERRERAHRTELRERRDTALVLSTTDPRRSRHVPRRRKVGVHALLRAAVELAPLLPRRGPTPALLSRRSAWQPRHLSELLQRLARRHPLDPPVLPPRQQLRALEEGLDVEGLAQPRSLRVGLLRGAGRRVVVHRVAVVLEVRPHPAQRAALRLRGGAAADVRVQALELGGERDAAGDGAGGRAAVEAVDQRRAEVLLVQAVDQRQQLRREGAAPPRLASGG
mmetsp:Transcript_15943/g.52215  ORF Transcript_15943/g.52215 Transcript_15943/m.52215 type:complete len:359 (+) Transcript_15943:329-1405(+)